MLHVMVTELSSGRLGLWLVCDFTLLSGEIPQGKGVRVICRRSEHYQRVTVNGSKSDWTPVVSSVPQGKVLGPVSFNIFINDIVDEVESEIRPFTDDCVCYRPVASVQDCEQLQKDIDHLTSWAKKWYMRFEPSKCKSR